jgi:flagellar assembly factor FliW
MQIETTRFGTIDFPDEQVIEFEQGLIGFYDEHQFVVINHGASELIAWLQSVTTPALALPVVSAHAFSGYPDVPVEECASRSGMGGAKDDFAMVAVLSAQSGQPATVNLLAPIVIDANQRRGAQIILDNTRFSARELFLLPSATERKQDAAPTEDRQVG